MKMKKYFFIFAVVIGNLCIPAFGEVELSPLQEQDRSVLLGRHILAGIEELYVVIVPPDSEPRKDGPVWKELEAKVESKLKEAGIKIAYVTQEKLIRSLDIPELRVYIDMLKLSDSQQYVFSIQTSFATGVYLAKEPKVGLKADVWKVGPVMEVASAEIMAGTVTDLVLEQVKAFIHAYLAANPQDEQGSDTKTTDTVSPTVRKEQARPARSMTVAEYKYVASKNSKVFHGPACSSAKRIKPENLVGYNSRAEAIRAGKRPCKRCKP